MSVKEQLDRSMNRINNSEAALVYRAALYMIKMASQINKEQTVISCVGKVAVLKRKLTYTPFSKPVEKFNPYGLRFKY